MQKRMEFKTRHVRGPGESHHVVNQDITNVRATLAARHRKYLDPPRSEIGRIFFIKEIAVNAVWISF